MQLSLNEVVILACFNMRQSLPRDQLAWLASGLLPSTKFDSAVALAEIKTLEDRRFIRQSTDRRSLELTPQGHAAVLEAIPVIENLRAALAGTSYRIPR